MARSRLVLLAVAGACTSLVLGSVVARTSDSVTSQGNSVQTGTYEIPHDIQAAVSSSSDCSTAAFSQGPITLARASTINFGQNGNGGNDPTFRMLCLKNSGVAAGAVYVSFANVADTEVGDCTASEAAANEGNDTTCAAGGTGELGPILAMSVSDCSGSGQFRPASAYSTPVRVVTSLAAGATCRVFVSDRIATTATETQKSAGQTDRYQYDLVLTLQDS